MLLTLIYVKLVLLFTDVISLDLNQVRFLYLHDISEHCRRRVVPSVFLGQHVLKADSKMIQLTRLELPYNCFITIRTESSNHIILVVQIQMERDLVESCKTGDQLVVLQVADAFGGFWSMLPQSLKKHPYPPRSTYYTMSVTMEPENDDGITNSTISEKTDEEVTPVYPIVERQETMIVEVPLVNISKEIIPADLPIRVSDDLDNNFDKYFNVIPSKDVSYETQLVPLVEISTVQHRDDYRRTQDEELFQINYNQDIFGLSSTTKIQEATTSLYNRNRHSFITRRFPKETSAHNTNITTRFAKTHKRVELKKDRGWGNIRHLIKSLNLTNYDVEPLTTAKSHLLKRGNITTTPSHIEIGFSSEQFGLENKNSAQIWSGRRKAHEILDKARISRLKDFTSFAKSTLFDKKSVTVPFRDVMEQNEFTERPETTTKLNLYNLKKSSTNSFKSENINNLSHNKIQTTLNIVTTNSLKINSVRNDEVNIHSTLKLNKNYVATRTTAKQKRSEITQQSKKAYVDHESWENVVLGAPEMMSLLNKTHTYDTKDDKRNEYMKQNREQYKLKKRKRFINAISVNDRPQAITTRSHFVTGLKFLDKGEIAKEFAELVEVPNGFEEIIGRMSHEDLQYVNHIPLFNICDYTQPKRRHVVLFNSSRIVLLIANFTLRSMTVVLTSAKTLDKSDATCTDTQLECQVSGHRVCIDSACACDGIPNCGSTKIYDEDRLRCSIKFFQNNRVVSIIAFIAILLTLIYSIYFWLQRCVPNVSQAFFVYIAGTENVLFLESVMRSPKDVDDVTKGVRDLGYFEDLTRKREENVSNIRNLCMRFFAFLTCKKPKRVSEEMVDKPIRQVYSFTQFELSTMVGKEGIDVSIQTGESLEIKNKDTKELKALKLLKTSDSISSLSESIQSKLVQIDSDEIYNENLLIDKNLDDLEPNKPLDVGLNWRESNPYQEMLLNKTRDSTELRVKKLRFENVADHDENAEGVDNEGSNADEDTQHATTSKDQRWFWNKKKSQKKQSQLPYR